MDNYTPNPFITQSIYDSTRPFATPSNGEAQDLVSGINNTTMQGLLDSHHKIDPISAVNGLLPFLSQIRTHTVMVVVLRSRACRQWTLAPSLSNRNPHGGGGGGASI